MSGHRARRPSGNCAICGAWRQSLHREHVIPKWKGGSDDDSNIQWICANCHEDKTRADLVGTPGPNRGRVFSPETREKMRQSALARIARDGSNHPVLRGADNGRAKLTREQVQEIRRRYAGGGVTYRQLGAEYGVHFSLIGYIVRGEKWEEEA